VHETLTVILLILLIAAAVGIVAKRLRIHYNIALVLTGAAVGAAQALPRVALDPAIVLQVFLPILLLEAALSTDARRLRENLAPVALLAVPGMLATIFAAAFVLKMGIALPWLSALLLGALLATTDTIAVIAAFRKVRVPHRLQAIVENESLFNDGTALVAFSTILAAERQGGFDFTRGLIDLAWVIGGGLAVGAAVGYIASHLMKRTQDHLMEIMITVLVAYASSLLSEELHASPVLAVVTAGLVVGTIGWKDLHATGKVAIRSFWEVAAYGVNSVIFLLIGLQADLKALWSAAPAIGWGLLALTAGRAMAVYPMLALLRWRRDAVPLRWQHLLVWGNLKGSLSMALVLSLPASLPHRDLMVLVVFGCTLVTLTIQGLTLGPAIRRMRIGQPRDSERRVETEQGNLLAARAGQAELDRLQQMGLLPHGIFQRMRARSQGAIARSERQLQDILAIHAREEERYTRTVQRHVLTVEKSAIKDALGSGILSEEVAAELTTDIDRRLAEVSQGGEEA
jgi:CPA1 family monovalent cation:H+ antiporter